MTHSAHTLDEIRSHIRDREYMSGISRERSRIKATSEVFTPTDLVLECLKDMNEFLLDKESTIIDRSCGDGQFLGEVLIRKMENGSTFEQALSTVYGVDLMQDNVDLCRERLLCGREDLRHIVEQNIVCADGLKYKYDFKPMTEARRKKEAATRKRNLKENLARQKAEEELRKLKEREKLLKKMFPGLIG